MSLSRRFRTAVAAGVAVLALAGCGASTALTIGGSTATSGLKGVSTTETLPGSNTTSPVITINGSALKPGASYQFNNVSLTVEGNVPANTSITGTNGQLVVTGNVGSEAKLSVNEPENTETVQDTCTGLILVGKVLVPYTYSCPSTTDTGPSAPFNRDPAIIIMGKTARTASVNGSTGIRISHGA